MFLNLLFTQPRPLCYNYCTYIIVRDGPFYELICLFIFYKNNFILIKKKIFISNTRVLQSHRNLDNGIHLIHDENFQLHHQNGRFRRRDVLGVVLHDATNMVVELHKEHTIHDNTASDGSTDCDRTNRDDGDGLYFCGRDDDDNDVRDRIPCPRKPL